MHLKPDMRIRSVRYEAIWSSYNAWLSTPTFAAVHLLLPEVRVGGHPWLLSLMPPGTRIRSICVKLICKGWCQGGWGEVSPSRRGWPPVRTQIVSVRYNFALHICAIWHTHLQNHPIWHTGLPMASNLAASRTPSGFLARYFAYSFRSTA